MSEEEKGFTSKKFGINKLQKINQELEVKIQDQETMYHQLLEEYNTLKQNYNDIMIIHSKEKLTQNITTQESQDQINQLIEEKNTLSDSNTQLETRLLELKNQYTNIEKSLTQSHDTIELQKESYLDLQGKFNDLKTRYNQLDDLYNSKTTLNSNFETTISQLSNQIILKDKHIAKNIEELNTIKQQLISYRDQNYVYRNQLNDKTTFIEQLRKQINDLTFKLDNSLFTEPEKPSQRSLGTPRITIYNDPITLQTNAPKNPRSINKNKRL